MARYKIILSLAAAMAAIASVPVIDSALADTPVINDEHVVYNLLALIHNGDQTIVGGGGAYQFSTAPQGDGWYLSTITASSPTRSETVSFLFKENDDLTFSVVSEEQGIDARFNSDAYTNRHNLPDPPTFITKRVSDSHQTDPTALQDDTEQACFWWTDRWEVESSQSQYVGKVRVDWDGPSFFWYYCLFPYDIFSTTINYEGQIRSTNSGHDNFDIGTPPYTVSGTWKYSSAN